MQDGVFQQKWASTSWDKAKALLTLIPIVGSAQPFAVIDLIKIACCENKPY